MISEFLSAPIDTTLTAIRRLEKEKKDDRLRDVDSVVCTGISGLLIAPAIAMAFGWNLAVVRKSSDIAMHSATNVETADTVGGYLFVDDLIDTGATLERVEKELEREFPWSKLSAVYLYHTRQFMDTLDLVDYRIHGKDYLD